MERETSGWCPFHGPVYLHHSDELQFRTWCTRADNVLELLLVRNVPSDAAQEIPASDIEVHSMSLEDVVNKLWTVKVPLNKQDRVWYMFRIDGKDDERWPDPATRFQPRDVFSWSEFRRPSVCVTPINRSSCWPTAIYELHVGTFTAEGTYLAAIEKLPFLKDLGVDCIEILPVSDWVGRWNWGYDGVCLYSPSRAYGNPDDLRRLVLRAHELGIQVWLDLVLNHLGIRGNLLSKLSPEFFSERHKTIWGPSWNLDGGDEKSAFVRRYITDVVLYYKSEFGFDGFRLDATHAIADNSEMHILSHLAQTVHRTWPDCIIVGEDDRNSVSLMNRQDPETSLDRLDGLWADDFHHEVRVALTGANYMYFRDFTGSAEDLAQTIKKGWLYSGQRSRNHGMPRGVGDPELVPLRQYIVHIQNHDQIGNRPSGDRLHDIIDFDAWIAASALFMLIPQTPMLFQGQEWMTSSPFCFFTDFDPEFGKIISEGRKKEFPFFEDAVVADPQDPSTFYRSKLNWNETSDDHHASSLAVYKDLFRLRREVLLPLIAAIESAQLMGHEGPAQRLAWRPDVVALADGCVAIHYHAPGTKQLLVVVALKATAGAVSIAPLLHGDAQTPKRSRRHVWYMRWCSEEKPQYRPASATGCSRMDSISVDFVSSSIQFARPGCLVLERHAHEPRIPLSTYRLQLHRDFPMRSIPVDYLKRLGVDTVYLSPPATAVAGSMHCYDGCDYTTLNAEVGIVDELRKLSHSFNLLSDWVPNHLACIVTGPANKWYWDLCKRGPSSPYAKNFDIFVHWERGEKLSVPVLGKDLEQCIADGEIAIRRYGDADIRLVYVPANLSFPLSEESSRLVDAEPDALLDVIHLHDPPRLQSIVSSQYYALCFWKEGQRSINYRRFFDVPSLIGVRQEDPDVFTESHRLLLDELVAEGILSGVRLDHTDGLADPVGYLTRFQRRTPRGTYLLIEKILQGGERLVPRNLWPVHGTTGYDYTRILNSWFISQEHAAKWFTLYETETGARGGPEAVESIEMESKETVLDMLFGAEVRILAHVSHGRVSPEAARALLSAFPVYRTFFRDQWPHERPGDRVYLEEALHKAAARYPQADLSAVRDLVLNHPGSEFTTRLQQITGPAMAKGVEDTVMYRHIPLLSANEVGADCAEFGLGTDVLHRDHSYRSQSMPYALLTSSTHDTKRSEDVRARLNALSEAPDLFASFWRSYRTIAMTDLDPHTDWLLIQSALGSWPVERERLHAYMMKATREAKLQTSWLIIDEQYEARMHARIDQLYDVPQLTAFLEDFVSTTVAPAGVANSLAQTLIKLAAPGVPDVYQGNEILDFSLVDPDNRRPVDYGHRNKVLHIVEEAVQKKDLAALYAVHGDVAKMYVTRQLLALRNDSGGLFLDGDYLPLSISGALAQHFIAFARVLPAEYAAGQKSASLASKHSAIIVIASRFPLSLHKREAELTQTFLEIPADVVAHAAPSCVWEDVLACDRRVSLLGKRIPLNTVLSAPHCWIAALLPFTDNQ